MKKHRVTTLWQGIEFAAEPLTASITPGKSLVAQDGVQDAGKSGKKRVLNL